MNQQRPFILLALDTAVLGVIFGAVTWLVWDSIESTPCDCEHCVTRAHLTLRAAALREHLADLKAEHVVHLEKA